MKKLPNAPDKRAKNRGIFPQKRAVDSRSFSNVLSMMQLEKRPSEKNILAICVFVFQNCLLLHSQKMVDLAQLVRVTDCGSDGRGFESHIPPQNR